MQYTYSTDNFFLEELILWLFIPVTYKLSFDPATSK